jgi:hypothetical protein
VNRAVLHALPADVYVRTLALPLARRPRMVPAIPKARRLIPKRPRRTRSRRLSCTLRVIRDRPQRARNENRSPDTRPLLSTNVIPRRCEVRPR